MLRILVISEANPGVKNRTSLLFNQIVPELSKKQKVEIFWISHYDKRKKERSDYQILDLEDFKNAKQVLEKIKPSLIYLNPNLSLIEDSFLITAKSMKIPTVEFALGEYFFKFNYNLKIATLDRIQQFFHKDFDSKDKKLNFKGIKYIKKSLFYINTRRSLGKNFVSALLEVYQHLTQLQLHKYNCDVIFLENKLSLEFFIKRGISKNRLFITGDPTYDRAFSEQIHTNFNNNKKQILFLTVNFSSLAGVKYWSMDKRNKMIKKLLSQYEIIKKEYSLSIKIHPVSENLSEYKNLLKNFKNDIPVYQNEDVYELINNADIILTLSTSTAGVIALIMKKPIIIWNHFGIIDDLLIKNKMALECQKSIEIKKVLDIASRISKEKECEENDFIKKYFGTGNSIQKIVNIIENMFTNNIK